MSNEKKYPKGIVTFKPHDNAPDFVKGKMIITPNTLVNWLKENSDLMTEYKGNKQVVLDILEGENGLYVKVNDFKPKKTEGNGTGGNETSDFPF